MGENPSRRKINIDLDELARIFDSNEPLISYYLGLEDGQIIQITEETRLHLNSIYDEYLDEDQDEIEMLAILDGLDLSDWERAELQDAHRVEVGFGERYIRIPTAESRQGYRDMEAFVETVKDPRLKTRLQHALQNRGAFRNFKDGLAAYPAERERWFAFKDAQLKARALEWLHNEEIEPV